MAEAERIPDQGKKSRSSVEKCIVGTPHPTSTAEESEMRQRVGRISGIAVISVRMLGRNGESIGHSLPSILHVTAMPVSSFIVAVVAVWAGLRWIKGTAESRGKLRLEKRKIMG